MPLIETRTVDARHHEGVTIDAREIVVAKLPEGASPDQMNLMLQSLLADRFKLVAHTEQRELPIYTLVKAREDGKLGSALKPAAVDCGPSGRGRGGPPPPGPGGPGAAPAAGLPCRALMAPGRLTAAGQPVEQLARMLAPQLGRPVYDKTGLTGSYDFELVFMPEGGRGMPDLTIDGWQVSSPDGSTVIQAADKLVLFVVG